MKGNQFVLGLAAVVLMVTTGFSAHASDLYKLKIKTSFVIKESCTLNGKKQTSQIELVVDNGDGGDVKKLTPAAAKISVCSPFADPVKETLPIPLPVALMKESAELPVGKNAGYNVKPAMFKGAFDSDKTPDYLMVKKIGNGKLEMSYMIKGSNNVIIGPIRAQLAKSSDLAAVPGFKAGEHLPISRVEVEVPDKGVTLKADIVSVQSE